MWPENAFLTLTYNDDNIYKCRGGSLNKREFQLFVKRLRKNYGSKIRYFHAGEYGEILGRPHHHVCCFNIEIQDKEIFPQEKSETVYMSETMNKIWGNGNVIIGEVTFESAAYVARYVLKKINGIGESTCYSGREKEYTTMSKGIGRPFLEEFANDIYTHDTMVCRGKEMRPPRYYDNIYKKINPDRMEEFKKMRVEKINPKENTRARLRARKEVKELTIKKLQRSL